MEPTILPQVRVHTDKYTVLSSSSIILIGDDPLWFEIVDLRFKVDFIHTSDEAHFAKGEVVGTGKDEYYSIQINCNDFSKEMNISNPMRVASLNGKPLLLIFSISPLPGKDSSHRLFTYTWYLEK